MGFLTRLQSVTKAPESLEELLVSLCQYGKPRLGVYTNGWHCHVDMHVQSRGTTFEVKSEFGHETPMAAAKECAERIAETLAAIGRN